MLADFHRSVSSSYHHLIETIFNCISIIPFIVCSSLVLAYQIVKRSKKCKCMKNFHKENEQNEESQKMEKNATTQHVECASGLETQNELEESTSLTLI